METLSKKGTAPWNKNKKGVQTWSMVSRSLLSSTMKRLGHKPSPCFGEKNNKWKGDLVSYSGLHRWVRFHLGTPDYCSMCGDNRKIKRHYHWSNKSGEYKRDLTDWQRLCVKCHYKYDHA